MSNPESIQLERIKTLFSDLMRIETRQRTGQLQIKSRSDAPDSWIIYFHDGKIVWVSGGKHPVRRWYRAIKCSEPALFQAKNFTQALNEYQQGNFIAQAIENNTLLLNKAKMVIQSCWQEVFFDLINLESLHPTWTTLAIVPQQSVWLYVDTTVKRTMPIAEEWQRVIAPYQTSLPNPFSPDLVPVILNPVHLQQHVSITAHQVLTEKLNGCNTFWDLAVVMQQPLVSVVSLLLPLLQNQVIQLIEIPDLLPVKQNDLLKGQQQARNTTTNIVENPRNIGDRK
jgi:two-component system, chemotaxis family, response regulator PixG